MVEQNLIAKRHTGPTMTMLTNPEFITGKGHTISNGIKVVHHSQASKGSGETECQSILKAEENYMSLRKRIICQKLLAYYRVLEK